MTEPKTGTSLTLRWIAVVALIVGSVAMLTAGQPNTAQAAVFGGGCALAALAALLLESILG